MPSMVHAQVGALEKTATGGTGKNISRDTEPRLPYPRAGQGDQVLIKRQALRLIPAERYRVICWLEPKKQIRLSATCEGVVRQLHVAPGEEVKLQAELVRLESTPQRLGVQRAQAEYRAATLELKLAEGRGETALALAQAKLDAAKANLDLAEYLLDQTFTRATMAGTVLRLHVSEGEYVHPGQLLVELGDLSTLAAEIPLEKSQAQVGQLCTVAVGEQDIQARIESVMPLHHQFAILRELYDSLVSAKVVIENDQRKYQVGEVIHPPTIPRDPLAEVPLSAIQNDGKGGHKVQVLRKWQVRDLPARLMRQAGSGYVLISCPLAAEDEVIYEWSHELPDGFVLRPASEAANLRSPAGDQRTTSPQGMNPPTRASTGF